MQTQEMRWSASSINSLPPDRRRTVIDGVDDDEARLLIEDWRFWARDEQLAPPGDWRIWLFMGGRGSGKTRAGAEWIAQGIREGRMQRVALIGTTHHEARSVMIEGQSGLLSVSEGAQYQPSNRRVLWPCGAVASVLSADEADSIRGHQFDGAWCDELGCPAVDKGANEPNVFVDPKSSESLLPYYSSGGRDDLMQRRFLEAHLNFWTVAANNPASPVYSGRMVDTANIRVWCWDARPYPFFPALTDVWGDAANYALGHWLNGRLGGVLLGDLVTALCADADFDAADVSDLDGLVTGFAVTDTMSPRDAINPLSVGYQFDAVESEGVIKFVMRGRPDAAALSESDLVIADGAADFGFSLTRAQETDLPLASRISYIEADADYRQAVVEARRLVALSDRVAQSTLPIVMDQTQASGIGARLLQDAWVMRETAQFSLAPSQIALDATDEVKLNAGGRTRRLRLTQIDDAGARAVQAVATDPSIYDAIVGPQRSTVSTPSLSTSGRALVVFLDLPLLTADQNAWDPFAAAFAKPWPGGVVILKGW